MCVCEDKATYQCYFIEMYSVHCTISNTKNLNFKSSTSTKKNTELLDCSIIVKYPTKMFIKSAPYMHQKSDNLAFFYASLNSTQIAPLEGKVPEILCQI